MENYEQHLKVAKLAGEQASCVKKIRYSDYQTASKASENHNKWEKRNHDVEPYPCPFCERWHVGKIIPKEVLEDLVKRHEVG